MDTGNILQEMATCDFSAPLSVKIMYDDSDEEFHDDLITISEKSVIENSSLPVITERDTEQTVQNKYVKEKPNSTNRTSTTNVKCQKGKSPCKDVTVKKVLKRKKSAETEIKNKKLVDDDINNGNIQENMYFPHNVIISYSKNIIDNNNTGKDNMKTVRNKRANDYIDDLVLAVSESLINIIGSYYKLAEMIKTKKCNPLQVEDLKKQYKRIKYHFFQLSYCTIVTIILDFQKHKCFSEEFIDNTIQIAKERHNVNYTTQQIKPFYDEMIAWAKMKKNWLHNLQLNNIYKAQEPDLPTLRQHLSEPSQQASRAINDNRSSQPNDITSVAAPTHHQNCHTCSSYDVLTHVTPNSAICRVNESLDTSRFKPVSNIASTNNLPTTNHVNHVPNVYSTFFHPNMPNNNNIQHQNHRETNRVHLQNNQNLSRLPQAPNMPHVALPSYSDTWKWFTNGMVIGNHNQSNAPQAAAPQNDVPIDTTRSSVSTDSGFMSPLQFNNDNTIVEEHQMMTPLITDVTSLNPAALQMLEGRCFICEASTKKKCLGCYQVYYCSFGCQRSDWESHMDFCKKSRESRVA